MVQLLKSVFLLPKIRKPIKRVDLNLLFQKLRGWLRAEGWCRGELMAAGISGREQGRRRDEMAKLDRAATGIARWWRGWSKSHRGLGLGVPASAGLLEVTEAEAEAEEEEPERGVREQHE